MPEYVVEVPVRVTVETRSAVLAWAAALAIVSDTLEGVDDMEIREADRSYSPARIQETLRSRKKSIAAVVVDAKEHPDND